MSVEYEGSRRVGDAPRRTGYARRIAALGVILAAAGACNDGVLDGVSDPLKKTIGPEGGTVSATDGGATLGVPADALTTPVIITLSPVDDGSLAGEALYVSGTAYEVAPDGLQLLKPARLRIRYDPDVLPEGTLEERLRVRERSQSTWRETAENRVGLQDHTVEAALDHFSMYALVALDEATIGVTSVTVEPPQVSLDLGATEQLVAVAEGEDGLPVARTFEWSSSNEAVASVAPDGTVTANMGGSSVITAQTDGQAGTATVTVPVASVVIDPIGNEPLEVGGTLQLVARAYDGSGAPMPAVFTWASSNDAVTTVDEEGLVTAAGTGDATITASIGAASSTVAVRVVGESETLGNNLSWPVVFADGIGLTGSPVATDPGVRPSTAEADAYAELSAIPVTNPTTEFFHSGNVPDVESYYLQGTANTWRAQIVDGSGEAQYDASAHWGDNIAGGSASLKVDRPVRVEVALSTTDGATLLGYNMPYVDNPSSPEEIQGTDGTTSALIPLIYTDAPELIIEQLDGPGGDVIATVMSGPYEAEINVGGRVIYGAQFRPMVTGTYRLRFILASGANVRLVESNASLVSAMETAIEVQVTP